MSKVVSELQQAFKQLTIGKNGKGITSTPPSSRPNVMEESRAY